MVIDGERIKDLVRRASKEVILCSPFIKARVFEVILNAVPESVTVRVVTRWRPPEIASGFSDLEVFDIANERRNTDLRLLQSLHAKLYTSDDACLVGSANLTASALGWVENPNVEILIPAQLSAPEVSFLRKRLSTAIPATFQIRSEMAALVEALQGGLVDESNDLPSNFPAWITEPWLPRCGAPGKLFLIYTDKETNQVVEDTRSDALEDLRDLNPPSGLGVEEFSSYVQETLRLMPGFCRILDNVPAGLSDSQGVGIIANIRKKFGPDDAARQWRIVRDWIDVFFQDHFEVAPGSYVVRLKSR